MRARQRRQPPPVAGQVPGHRHQEVARIVAGVDQRSRRGERQEGVERLLDGVERLLGTEPLAAGHRDQTPAVVMDQPPHPAQEGVALLRTLEAAAARLVTARGGLWFR